MPLEAYSDFEVGNKAPSMNRPARHIVSATSLAASLLLPCGAHADDALEEIIVVASKTARPLHAVAAQVTTFDRQRLADEQVRDLGDLARTEAALEADTDGTRFGTTGISIRGIGGNRVALELDGIPLPTQFDVGNFADSSRTTIDPSLLAGVEILRGPASALYGSDAIGGVVVLATLSPDDLVEPGRTHHLGGGAGYFSATAGSMEYANGAWSNGVDGLLLAGVHRRGSEPDNQARDVADDRLDLDQWSALGKWTHADDRLGELTFAADLYWRGVDGDLHALLGYERFADTHALRSDDSQRTDRQRLTYVLPRLAWLDEASLLLYRQSNRTEQRTDEWRSSRGTDVQLARNFFFDELGYGSELRARRDFDSGPLAHVLVGGLEWDRQEIEQRRDATQTTLATGAISKTLLGETFPLRDLPRSTSDEIGLYLQDELTYADFTLVPGLRWDWFQLDAATDTIFDDTTRLTDDRNDELSLRLGATYRVITSLTLYANYAEGFRAPPAEDVNLYLELPQFGVRALPNPDLEPEHSHNFELGLRWRAAGLRFDAAGYYSEYDDFIESRTRIGVEPDSGIVLFQSRNIAQATIYGTEANASFELGNLTPRLRQWSLETGVHWAHGENDGSDEPLNSVAPLKLISALSWNPFTLPLSASLRLTHLAKKDDVDENIDEVFVPPDATLLDCIVTWRPRANIDLHFGLYNITDARYWHYNDTRNYTPDDPRVEIASRPGIHADLTLDVRF